MDLLNEYIMLLENGFIPPETVSKNAERGLQYRKKAKNKGGLTPKQASEEGVGSGVQRAINLKNKDSISIETIKKMVNFFNRHEKNKDIDIKYKETPWEDKGYVAWLLWGGDAGKIWANKILTKYNKDINEGLLSRNKSTEESVAKMIIKLIKDKSKEFNVNPKTVLDYIQLKML